MAYCPVIAAQPTQMDTVYTTLVCSVSMTKRIQQETSLTVADQAIYVYAKAIEITRKHANEFRSVVLRLGAFHTAYNFLERDLKDLVCMTVYWSLELWLRDPFQVF